MFRESIGPFKYFVGVASLADIATRNDRVCVLNILGDTVETVTPFLARAALANTKQGGRIDWMTPAKAAGRFALAPFRKRDILAELEARPHLTVR